LFTLLQRKFEVFISRFNTHCQNDDAVAVLHMHDGMVWHHPINKLSWIPCIYYIGNVSLIK